MIVHHKSQDRGSFTNEWLDTKYSFSFSNYYDPSRMGFLKLRVVNDDVIAPGSGFPPHSHQNMEIITYIISGSLSHRDSSGGEGMIHQGQIQIMSAGAGVTHSEFNASEEETRLLQIWIEPSVMNVLPRYETKKIPQQPGIHHCIEPLHNGNNTGIYQDVHMYIGRFDRDQSIEKDIKNRGLFVFVIEGEFNAEGYSVLPGDSLEIRNMELLTYQVLGGTHLIMIDLPV